MIFYRLFILFKLLKFKKILKLGLIGLTFLILMSCSSNHRSESTGHASFYVDSIEAVITPDQLNANENVQRKFLNLTACIKDNALMNAVLNLEFEIQTTNETGIVRVRKRTNDRGCIIWQELFEYDPLDDEKIISLDRLIVGVNGHSGSELVKIAYDPWGEDKVHFQKREEPRSIEKVKMLTSSGGIIERKDFKSSDLIRTSYDIRTKIAAKTLRDLDIHQMNLDFLGRDFANYEISNLLDLIVAQKFRLNMTMSLIRESLQQGKILENVNAGNFRFYFVFTRDLGREVQDLNEIVSATQIDTKFEMGRLNQDLILKFEQLSALASRLNMYVSVESLDKPIENIADKQLTHSEKTNETFSVRKGFRVNNFESSIPSFAGSNNLSLRLIPSKTDAKNLFLKFKSRNEQVKQLNAFELFRIHSGYQKLNLKPIWVSHYEIHFAQMLEKILNKKALSPLENTLIGQIFCHKLLSDTEKVSSQYSEAFEDCSNNYQEVISVHRRDFIMNILNSKPRSIGINQVETINISSNHEVTEKDESISASITSFTKSIYANISGQLSVGKTWSSRLIKGQGPEPTGYSLPTGFNYQLPFSKSPLGASLGAAVGFRISVGHDWIYSTGITSVHNKNDRITSSRGVTLYSEANQFEFDAETKSCVFVNLSPSFLLKYQNLSLSKGKYLCNENTQKGTRTEMYYFINEVNSAPNSPMSDNASAHDNPWRMFVRGAQTYNLFANLISQKDYKVEFTKIPDAQLGQEFADKFLTQEYPGLLSPLEE